MRWFYRLLVWFKSWLRRVRLMDSFCKECGRSVHDFVVDDETWLKVNGSEGGVLCYDCFCEKCRQAGVLPVWRLVALTDTHCIRERYRMGEDIEILAACFGMSEEDVLAIVEGERYPCKLDIFEKTYEPVEE